MSDILLVIAVTSAGSLLSLIGGLFLLLNSARFGRLVQLVAVPFAAGALLAAALADLVPEALESTDATAVSYAVLAGIVGFFIIERVFHIFHHHHHGVTESKGRNNAGLIIIGDSLHNLLDGLAVGAAFLVSPATGIIATIAVSAHEIPQEIGDFALLLNKGMRRRTIVSVNLMTAFITVTAAVGMYVLGNTVALPLGVLLAATAGFFIYIAVSDIIPSIHAEEDRRAAGIQTVVLTAAVLFVAVTTTVTHGLLHAEDEAEHGEHDAHHRKELIQ